MLIMKSKSSAYLCQPASSDSHVHTILIEATLLNLMVFSCFFYLQGHFRRANGQGHRAAECHHHGHWSLGLVSNAVRDRLDICHKKCSAQVDGMIILILFWAARLCRRV